MLSNSFLQLQETVAQQRIFIRII